MLAQLAARLPEVPTVVAGAEALPLPDAAVDVVTAAQAAHWFDPGPAAAEMARVLRPGGTVGLVWNMRDDRAPWVAALSALLAAEGVERFRPAAVADAFARELDADVDARRVGLRPAGHPGGRRRRHRHPQLRRGHGRAAPGGLPGRGPRAARHAPRHPRPRGVDCPRVSAFRLTPAERLQQLQPVADRVGDVEPRWPGNSGSHCTGCPAASQRGQPSRSSVSSPGGPCGRAGIRLHAAVDLRARPEPDPPAPPGGGLATSLMPSTPP